MSVPTVDLPQPDSPTEAVGLALLDRDGHAVDGGNDALLALEEAGACRLVLARGLLDVQQNMGGHRRDGLCHGLVPGLVRVKLGLQIRRGLVAILDGVEARE